MQLPLVAYLMISHQMVPQTDFGTTSSVEISSEAQGQRWSYTDSIHNIYNFMAFISLSWPNTHLHTLTSTKHVHCVLLHNI